jgi:hypothetical protein
MVRIPRQEDRRWLRPRWLMPLFRGRSIRPAGQLELKPRRLRRGFSRMRAQLRPRSRAPHSTIVLAFALQLSNGLIACNHDKSAHSARV